MSKVIFLGTENCRACKMLKNAMEYANIQGYEYKCINPTVKEDMDFIKKYNAFTFPTLLKLDEDGNEIGRICNNKSLTVIREFLEDCE